MTECIYCKKEFVPNSNNQKTCLDKECKNKMNRDKMRRYRKKNRGWRKKYIINRILRENGPISICDIRQIARKEHNLRINIADISEHITVFSKNCKISYVKSGEVCQH